MNRRHLLDHAVAQQLVLSGKQILHEIVTAFVSIARGAGEMMVDPHFGGTTEITRNRKDFGGRLTRVDLVLREGAGSADGEKLGCDSNKAGKQQLFTVELRSEARHGVE